MWTRAELKDKAKRALDRNYWKIVLVSLIILFISGGMSGGGSSQITNRFESDSSYEENNGNILDLEDMFSDSGTKDDEFDYYEEDLFDDYNEFDDEYSDDLNSGEVLAFAGIIVVIVVAVIIIITVIGFVYGAFLLNPIDVGVKRFLFKSLNEKAELKELSFAFDNNYKNVIKILFIRDIKILLWTLLFIIPGIVKGYEYYMMPYLLAENPNLTKEEAFRLSKQMMTGNKWKTFVLELSFIGWDILSAITCGIVGIFFVNPYKFLTYAALYEELSAINGYPARACMVAPNYTNSYMQSDYYVPVEKAVQIDETTQTSSDYDLHE
jgi:uncharacterized membrane protein